MISLRLDAGLEKAVSKTAKQLGLTRSELIRQSIIDYLAKQEKPTAWELGEDVFGSYASENENLSRDRKSLLTELMQKKHDQNSD